jgi:hypothetical protein
MIEVKKRKIPLRISSHDVLRRDPCMNDTALVNAVNAMKESRHLPDGVLVLVILVVVQNIHERGISHVFLWSTTKK